MKAILQLDEHVLKVKLEPVKMQFLAYEQVLEASSFSRMKFGDYHLLGYLFAKFHRMAGLMEELTIKAGSHPLYRAKLQPGRLPKLFVIPEVEIDQAKTDVVKKKTKLVNEKIKSTAPTVSTQASTSSGQSIMSKDSVVITNEPAMHDGEEDQRLHKAKSPK